MSDAAYEEVEPSITIAVLASLAACVLLGPDAPLGLMLGALLLMWVA